MRGQTLTVTRPITFHVEECCVCGVYFAMTQEFYDQRIQERAEGHFYCPNGHVQHYVGKSDAQKAKEAQRALHEAETRLQAERDQRLASERERKRLEKRVKGGVCPCCKRSFVQLTRHMKAKHPDYAEAQA